MPRKKGSISKKKAHLDLIDEEYSILKEYLNDFDLKENKLLAKKILYGHIIAHFKHVKKSRRTCSDVFYSVIQNSENVTKSLGELVSKSEFNELYISVIGKYDYIIKKEKKNSKFCSQFLKQIFSISSNKNSFENHSSNSLPDISRTDNIEDIGLVESKDSISKQDLYLSLLKELNTENENEIDIYERYFDLSSQDIDTESKNKKLGGLMEDAMSKLHDVELHNHKLRSALAELLEDLNNKNNNINELELKLKNDSQRGNIVVNLTKQIKEKEDLVIKLKFENKQFKDLVKQKDDYIKVLEDKTARKVEKSDKSLVVALSDARKTHLSPVTPGKSRAKRKKDDNDEVSVPAPKEKGVSKDKPQSNSLEKKVNKLVHDCNNQKISELLLESFPDISISDFEVILKVLTDSNALLGQRIVHKWNVNGKDITYYGTIKENLKNQKKFYITYGKYANREEADTDFELVDYTSLISDIILRDLSFLDPCSLF